MMIANATFSSPTPSVTSTTIAIATTILSPPPNFLTWLDYHLLRVQLILIFLDDPSLRHAFLHLIGGRHVVFLNGAEDAPHLSPPGRLILRQVANMRRAVEYLLERGVDWLLHMDVDELLYSDLDMAWARRDDVDHVRFRNHEAVPLGFDSQDPFRDCVYFKPNAGKLPFMAYANGKSAVRLRPGVEPLGPHAFTGYAGQSITLPADDDEQEPVLLHYPTPSFESWKAKYVRYGSFSDHWFDDARSPIGVGFMLQSRDHVQRALATGDWSESRVFFDEMVMDEMTVRRALADGHLRRYAPLEEELGRGNDFDAHHEDTEHDGSHRREREWSSSEL